MGTGDGQENQGGDVASVATKTTAASMEEEHGNMSLNTSFPRFLAPTIAAKAPPSSNDQSRFDLHFKSAASATEERSENPPSKEQQNGTAP